jgi:hypothetical protein
MAGLRIGGVWADHYAPVDGLTDSTIWRREGWSGDYQASCRLAVPPKFEATWLREGQTFEVVEHGLTTWGGIVSGVDAGSDGIGVSAYGYGVRASEFDAIYDSDPAGPVVELPTTTPNTAVDYAIAGGLPWRRHDSLGATALGDPEGIPLTIAALMERVAQKDSKRWHVDSIGEVTLQSDPTSPVWMLAPGSSGFGTVDPEFVTRLRGLYATAVDASTNNATAWAMVKKVDDDAAAAFGGHRERTVDLTALGVITSGVAQSYIDGRFALIGARMAFTNGVDAIPGNLIRLDGGIASPMGLRAGHMLRVPDVMDLRSTPTVRAGTEVVLGEVVRHHDEQRAYATPVRRPCPRP